MDSNDKKSKYIENIFSFLLINLFPKISAFIVLPICTRVLSTNEYGIGDTINTAASLMVLACSISIADGVFRFMLLYNERKNSILTVGTVVTLISGIVIFIVILIINRINFFSFEGKYLWYVFFMYFFMAINRLEIYYYKGDDKISLIKIGSFVQSLSLIGLIFVLLFCFNLGLIGYILSTIISYVISDIVLFFFGDFWRVFIDFSWDSALSRSIFLYSFPLMFSGLAWWINNVLDRYILLWIQGANSVGIYAVASKIPSMINFLYLGIINAFQIATISDTNGSDQDGFWNDIYEETELFLILVGIALIILNLPLARILYGNDFFEGWKYVPILISAMVFKSLGDMGLSVTMKEKKSKLHAFIVGIGACINIVGNLILIPIFSTYGAAISTLISFFCIWVISYFHAIKYYSINPKYFQLVSNALILLLTTFLGCFGERTLLIQILILVLYCFDKRYEIKRYFQFIFLKVNKR